MKIYLRNQQVSNASGLLIILPPAVADITNNGKRGKGEIEDAGVHAFGRFFSELLRCLRTYGALGR